MFNKTYSIFRDVSMRCQIPIRNMSFDTLVRLIIIYSFELTNLWFNRGHFRTKLTCVISSHIHF